MRRMPAFALLIGLLAACSQPATPAPQPTSAIETAPAQEVSPLPAGTGPRRPFPQHVAYMPGTILPDHVSQGDLDQAVREFYDAWKRTYLIQGCGEGRYYVYMTSATGGGENTISTSEGHGYGMVITALMAGHDPQAQTLFDGLYRFFKDHPSVSDPYLMAWNQVEGCGNADGENTGSATDGDMDIAYALLLADRQWGSDGAINYREEAARVVDAILAREVSTATNTMLLGDWVQPGEAPYSTAARSSDFMPGHLRAYYQATGGDVWMSVLDATYGIVSAIQSGYSPQTGLLPDFIQDVGAGPRPADPGFLEGDMDGSYYYNACRDPWRIGVDWLLSGEPRALAALQPINAFIRKASGGDPAQIKSGYALNGSATPDNDYTDLSFVAPLGVGAMVEAQNQPWLDALWDFIVEQRIEDGGYYDSTLKMMALIVMSGNWWEP